MVFMTYANVVYSYGTERFAKAAAEIGMDGLILPDVPFEEKEEFAIPFKEHGLDLISLIATTSPRENCHDRKRSRRIRNLGTQAGGENGSPVRWSYCRFSNCESSVKNMEQIVSHTFPRS